ncbi:MAG TPA: AraC family transcriptional regulator [Steroidobacter sp.]|uniref:AraC family transcriptional regulator n=1 Tax=Steroidobacter sp. TaxID=1978227 RepID=UPI002ED7B7B0
MSTSFETISAERAGVARTVMASSPTFQLGGVSLASWRAKRVRLYIEANLEHRLDTDILARVACASRAHFCRCFKRTFGVTVHQYVVQRRIERAQQLMLTTQATLTEIAASCGMSDHSHLTRMFRRAVAESPSAWRKRNLGVTYG